VIARPPFCDIFSDINAVLSTHGRTFQRGSRCRQIFNRIATKQACAAAACMHQHSLLYSFNHQNCWTHTSTGIFLLLRSVMLQMLAFDPTHRLSADVALKIMARSTLHLPEASMQRPASPPPANTVAVVAGSPNGSALGGEVGGDGDYWKLENILRVSGE
jgi:hypothetical protein